MTVATTAEEIAATVRIPTEHEELRAFPCGLVLSILSGTEVVKTHHVAGETLTVGRSEMCDVTLNDPSVSEFHFRIHVDGAHVAVEDMGSSNGLWVGRARIERAEMLVGTRFRAGSVRLQIGEIETIKRAVSQDDDFYGLRGASESTRGMFSLLARVAPTPLSVLVTGETGVGKGQVARALHQASGREGPFVTVDCTTLPRELAEGLLFGHVKGAFTGAGATRRSPFEDADGGTIFLDEIGELSMELQPKLLRVIDEKIIQRVGETRVRPVDVRIIAATNRHVPQEISEGRFRADLYHRLAGFVVRVPPLRDRRDDIPFLASWFLGRVSAKVGRPLALSDSVVAKLKRRRWEGNVRELLQTIERAGYLCQGSEIEVGDLTDFDQPLVDDAPARERPLRAEGDAISMPLKPLLDDVRKDYLRRLFTQCETLADAASIAGMSERGLQTMAGKVGLSPATLLRS